MNNGNATYTPKNDDTTTADANAYFTVIPKVGCMLYEGGVYGASGSDCALALCGRSQEYLRRRQDALLPCLALGAAKLRVIGVHQRAAT